MSTIEPCVPARARRAVVAALLCALAMPAFAAGNQASSKPSGGDAPRTPAKVTFIAAPSGETPAAREKRLRRECKGRPNAGMCLGHAR